MSDLKALCEKHQIKCTFGKGKLEKEHQGKPWRHIAYAVRLSINGRDCGVEFPYKMGLKDPPRKGADWREERAYSKYLRERVPTVDGVIGSLLCDASCWESAIDFDDFCRDFGYSNDSIRAMNVYRACADTSKRLRAFLGPELFETLSAVER